MRLIYVSVNIDIYFTSKYLFMNDQDTTNTYK